MHYFKRLIWIGLTALLFQSCGSTFLYHTPMPDTYIYQGQGEVQGSGSVGVSGVALSGGYALKDNFALGGRLQATPWLANGALIEVDASYFADGWFMATAGVGYGHFRSEEDTINYNFALRGDLYRPFVQVLFQTRRYSSFFGLESTRTIGLKTSYAYYDGAYGFPFPVRVQHGRVLFEPVVSTTTGSEKFRLELTMSAPLYEGVFRRNNIRDQAYPFPFNVSVGFRIMLFYGQNSRFNSIP